MIFDEIERIIRVIDDMVDTVIKRADMAVYQSKRAERITYLYIINPLR